MPTEPCAPSFPPQYEWVPYPSESYQEGRRWKLMRNGQMVGRVVRPFWQQRWEAIHVDRWFSPAHSTMHSAARELYGYVTRHEDNRRCHSARDGECNWRHCPQLRDKEPAATGRHCPYDTSTDDE